MTTAGTMSFWQDFKQFLHYIKRPTFTPRLPGRRGDGWWCECKVHTPWKLLLKWLFFVWGFNIFVLAPIALAASISLGANNRINIDIPYLVVLAAIWAPIFEELLFRFGLRHPRLAMFYVPILVYAMNTKNMALNIGVVVVLLALFIVFDLRRQTGYQQALPFKWRRLYQRCFPAVFNISVLIFAAMHLSNYEFSAGQTSLLLPLLILPQWLTGLVVGWMRMRDSFACGVVFHAAFNGVPVVIAWTFMQFLPEDMALSWIF